MFSRIQLWINQFMRNPLESLINFTFFAIALLLSLILHECAHGWVAMKCGDPTAKMLGRLSLDPRKHVDPVGMICMVFLGIGWAKPVPVNPFRFRNRERDMILVSIAGIIVNFVLFLLSLFAWVAVFRARGPVIGYIRTFLSYMYTFNISLAVFNLLPIPPLDGFRLMNHLFFKGNLNVNDQVMTYVRYGFLLVCISGIFSNAFSRVCTIIISFFANLFIGILF